MGNRYALLISSSEYFDADLDRLDFPPAGVEEFASVLADPQIGGFNVVSMVNRDLQEARIAIARLCGDVRIDDVILIYLSGLSARDSSGRLYLAFKDSQHNLLSATGLDGQFLLDELRHCRAKSKVVIADCMFAGAILSNIIVPDGVVLLAATRSNEHIFGIPELGHGRSVGESAFTSALTEGLRTGDADSDGDGMVTFNELFAYAKRKVERDTEGRQNPRIYDLTGQPVIAGRAARPIFLSYSRSDFDFVSRLGEELRNGGHKVWMDTKGIDGGDDWRERIGAAIDASKLVLTILSSAAFSSSWVRRELSYADKAGKPILPVFYKDYEIPSWYELQFGHIQRLDLTRQADNVGQEPLLSSVKQILRYRPDDA